MSAKKTVLVVGGGGAGARLVRALSEMLNASAYNLVLVSSHPFYIHYPATLRALVTEEGTLEDRILIPYDNLFINGNGIFMQGTVTAIQAERGSKRRGKVVLESGAAIGYDVLALAPGSHWETFLTFPSDYDQTRGHIQEWRDKFKKAKKVVIAGGGAVGLELAGEIRDSYPNTEVTIVHGGRRLLNATYPLKFRKDVEKRVRANNINLILDDYIDDFPAIMTRKGAMLDADLIIPARGPRPNSEFIAESLGYDTVTDRGFVKIKPTMQLQSYPSIFAMGDTIDHPEEKQVAKYPGHASLVAANILSFLKGAELKEYKGTFELIFVTNGKRGGSAYIKVLWGLMFGNTLTSAMKSRDLFIGPTRQNLGLAS